MADANHALDHWIGPTPVPTRGLDRFRLFKPVVADDTVEAVCNALEAAGLVVRVASVSPLRILGGSARSEGPPPVVFSDGFCVVGEAGQFTVSSTSPRGRAVDETSYESLKDAVDALVKAYGKASRSQGSSR